ncbi:MAG: S41 family peptidase [Syntrophomonadaceae bacterium]|nr:S41 family peptidase [Syntrophomonadaceae bacterium]
MRNRDIFQGIICFFAIIGFVFVGGLIYLFATNHYHLGSLVKVFWLTETRALENPTTSSLIQGSIRGMVSALGDPYSNYMPRDEYEELGYRLQGSFNGVGIVVGAGPDNQITVVAPIKDSPAAKAGIKSGDVITAINGESTQGLSVDDAVKLIRGEAGTQVEIRVYRESIKDEIDFKIIRQSITVDSVDSEIVESDPDIGYIQITHFTMKTPEEFGKHLNSLIKEGVRGIIIDLRQNPGGDFNAAVEIADMLIDKGDIVKIVNRNGRARVYEASSGGVDMPMVVLINHGSASSSEILAGALKDHKIATLVGEKSYGKGLVQTVYPLPGGAALLLTTDKYYTPNDVDINEVGIIPDYVVKNPDDSSSDLQLKKALQVLREKLEDR